MVTPDLIIERSRAVTPAEIIVLRGTTGIAQESEEIWRNCLEQALCTIIARSAISGELVGFAQVVGNARHAQITDLIVKTEYRRAGVAKQIGRELLKYVEENNIVYVGITYAPNDLWLKTIYEHYGFRQIDFAMWLERSINS